MLRATGPAQALGADRSWLRFGEEPKAEGAWAGRRLLWIQDKPAFELSHWCGTCPFLFQRLDGANESGSIRELSDRLAEGLTSLDESVIGRFAEILPAGTYIPMLLQVQPRLTFPVLPGDYFAEEQVDTWGLDSFWGLPTYPRTPYYRTFETSVATTTAEPASGATDAHLFEFVVPMVPPTWNDRDKVTDFAHRLATSTTPTAVAVSILDICQPAHATDGDYYEHWALTHFLLDGHHKMEAAARAGKPLQLLTLLAVDAGLATAEHVTKVPTLRASEPCVRRPA